MASLGSTSPRVGTPNLHALHIPNGLPISPSPHIRAGPLTAEPSPNMRSMQSPSEISPAQVSCLHCERCKSGSNTVSSAEPSPPLDDENKDRPLSLSQQINKTLKFGWFGRFSTKRRSGDGQPPRTPKTSPRFEFEATSPSKDWTEDHKVWG